MKVKINIEEAKKIFKDKLRRARTEKFKELDIAYQRADEEGDDEKKKAIIKQKQELRDITELPAIKKAKNISQLEKAWPFN